MNPVSALQIRNTLQAIPSWAKVLPNITDDTPFADCGMDSLALLELVSELQGAYGVEIPDDDVEKIGSISDTARYLNTYIA